MAQYDYNINDDFSTLPSYSHANFDWDQTKKGDDTNKVKEPLNKA